MQVFLKRSYKLVIKFDLYFRNIEVINYFLFEKVYNSVGDTVSNTPQFKP